MDVFTIDWNYRLMRYHGLDLETATLLSDAGVSWHDVQPLIAGRCSNDLILRLLMPPAWVEASGELSLAEFPG